MLDEARVESASSGLVLLLLELIELNLILRILRIELALHFHDFVCRLGQLLLAFEVLLLLLLHRLPLFPVGEHILLLLQGALLVLPLLLELAP